MCIWKQCVRNKYTHELGYFASWGKTDAGPVKPGGTVIIHEELHVSMSDEEITGLARETFLNLQNLVSEWHNREIA